MTLPPNLAQHKTMLAGILVIARMVAERITTQVKIDFALTKFAKEQGISRQYVYEVCNRALEALDDLAAKQPGRPKRDVDDDAPGVIDAASSVKIAVLRFRAEHPGAVSPRYYSPAFRRFVLELYDAWPQERTLTEFATAAEIPLDTLRDWVDTDRRGLTPAVPSQPEPRVPRDASALVRDIAEAVRNWSGSMREFIRTHAPTFDLGPGQLCRVLILFGLILPRRPRHWPKPPRFRGETEVLSPGAMLVCDGKRVELRLTGSDQVVHLNWQGIVDQATGTNTAVVVTEEETAQAVIDAHRESVRFLDGRAPAGLLIDRRLCQDDGTRITDAIQPTELIRAEEGRPTHKAMAEGAFGRWEQFVGPIEIDDSSPETLRRSIVREVIRAYCAGMDHAPHAAYNGVSRIAALREFVPSPEQRRRDEAFLRNLKRRHAARQQPARQLPLSRQLLDHAFDRYDCLRDKDPSGNLRRYLAYCDPTAVRRALALFDFRLQQDAIQPKFAHRYLRALVVSHHEEIELLHCEAELLKSARLQRQCWTEALQRDLRQMQADADSILQLLHEIAQRAAFGGLLVERAFWTEQLLSLLANHPQLSPAVRARIRRLYEAPHEKRLHLIERILSLENGIE